MLDAVFEHIHASCIAFGFIGAAIHIYRMKVKPSAGDVVGYLVIGSIMANLLAPQLLKVLSMFPLDLISLGVGATGKHFFLLIETIFNKMDLSGKTKNE